MSVWDILGAGLNLAGGVAGYAASTSAAKKQKKAQEQAAAGFRPYAALGDYAAGQLQGSLNKNALLKPFTGENLTSEPGYQFRLGEGEKAIDRAAGARGSRYSGATLKGLQRFAQDFASNEYQNAYNRDANTRTMNYNFLAGPTGIGQGAQGTIGQYVSNAGDARAAGTVGGINALFGGASDAYNVYNTNRYLQNNPYTFLLPSSYR